MAFNSSSYVFTENYPAEGHAGGGQGGDHAEPRGRPFFTQAVVPHSASVSGASACHDSEHPLFTHAEDELEITASTQSRVSQLMDPYHPNQDSQSQDSGDWPAYPPLDLPAGQAPFERHAATSTSFEHSFHHQNPSQNPTFSQQHDQNHPPQQQPQPHQQHQLHRLPFSHTPSHLQSQHHAQSHLDGSTGNVYANTSSSTQSYHAPRSSYTNHPTNTSTTYANSSAPGFQSQPRGPSRSLSQYSSQYDSQYTPPPSRLISTPMSTSLQHHQQQQSQIYDFADEQQAAPQRHSTGTTRLTSTPSGVSMSMHSAGLGSGLGMGLGMGVSSMRTASPPRRGHGHGQGYAPSHPSSNVHPHSHQHHRDQGVGSSSNSLLTSVAGHHPQFSNIGSQRFPLSLAGSLDPTTGIFYRSPEHPRLRTAQACEKCRTRKAKCSGEHPACKRCITRGLVCEYAKEGRVRGPNKPKNQSHNQGQQAKNGAGGAAGASSSNTGDAPSGSGADGGSGGGAPERTDADVGMRTDEAQYQQQDAQEQETSPSAAGGAGRGESSVPPSRRRHAAAAAAAASLQGFQSSQRQRQQDSSTPSSQDSVAGAPGEHRAALSSRRSYSQFHSGRQPQPIALGMGLLSTNIPAPVPHPLASPTAFGLGPVTGVVSTFTDASSVSPSPYSYTFPGALGAPPPVSSSSSSIDASSVPSSLPSSVSSDVSSMSQSSATIAQRRGVSPHTHPLGLGQRPGLRGTSGVSSVYQAPQPRLGAHIPIPSAYPYSIPSRTVSHAHAEGIVQGGTPHGHEDLSVGAYMHSTEEQVFQPVFDTRGTYHQQPQHGQQQHDLSYHEQSGDSSGYQHPENPGQSAYMRYQDEAQHQHDPQGQYTGAPDINDTHPYGADDDGSRTTRIPQYPLHNAPGQATERDEHRSSSSDGSGSENDRGAELANGAFQSHPPPPVDFLSGPLVKYSHDTSVSPMPAPATYLYAASSSAMSSTPTPWMPLSMPSTMMSPGIGDPQQQQIMPAAALGDVDDDQQQRAIDLVDERNPSRSPGGARGDVPERVQSQVDDSGRCTPQELHYTYDMGDQQQSQQQQYQDEERRRSALEFFQPQTPSDAQRSQQSQQLQNAEARFQSAADGEMEGVIAPNVTTVPQRDVNMVLDDVECPPPIHLPPPPMVQAMVHGPEGGTHDAGADAGATMGTRVYNPNAVAGAANSGGGCVSSLVDAGSVDAHGPDVGFVKRD